MDGKSNQKSRIIAAGIYAYLLLPFFIFAAGWLKIYLAVPVCALVAVSYWRCLKMDTFDYHTFCFRENWDRLIAAFVLILLWVYLSGVGGMCFQNTDHGCRNAIFEALVGYDWPVVAKESSRGMVYYIGFWMPSAVIGKLFGLEAGYYSQMIWAALGIFLMYLLLCIRRQKVLLWPLFVIIGFSGLDYVGWWLLFGKGAAGLYPYMEHLERWAKIYQYSSMTTQLFWVFNQAVPAWIATAFVFVNRENRSNMLLVLASVMLSATFPFVGLAPAVAYFMLHDFTLTRKHLAELFSFNNCVGVIVVGGVSFLYLMGNTAAGVVSGLPSVPVLCIGAVLLVGAFVAVSLPAVNEKWKKALSEQRLPGIFLSIGALLLLHLMRTAPASGMPLSKYLLFCFLEFGIYAIFVYPYQKKNPLYFIVLAVCFVCPLIVVGFSIDFCMRVSIPALFLLMLFVIDALDGMMAKKEKWFYVLVAVLCLGAITSFQEIHRSVKKTINKVDSKKSFLCRDTEIETGILMGNNFSGELEGNLVWKYLMRK